MAKEKEKNFRIKCTCTNAFELEDGQAESVDQFLQTKDSDAVEAIRKIIMEHYDKEHIELNPRRRK